MWSIVLFNSTSRLVRLVSPFQGANGNPYTEGDAFGYGVEAFQARKRCQISLMKTPCCIHDDDVSYRYWDISESITVLCSAIMSQNIALVNHIAERGGQQLLDKPCRIICVMSSSESRFPLLECYHNDLKPAIRREMLEILLKNGAKDRNSMLFLILFAILGA